MGFLKEQEKLFKESCIVGIEDAISILKNPMVIVNVFDIDNVSKLKKALEGKEQMFNYIVDVTDTIGIKKQESELIHCLKNVFKECMAVNSMEIANESVFDETIKPFAEAKKYAFNLATKIADRIDVFLDDEKTKIEKVKNKKANSIIERYSLKYLKNGCIL